MSSPSRKSYSPTSSPSPNPSRIAPIPFMSSLPASSPRSSLSPSPEPIARAFRDESSSPPCSPSPSPRPVRIAMAPSPSARNSSYGCLSFAESMLGDVTPRNNIRPSDSLSILRDESTAREVDDFLRGSTPAVNSDSEADQRAYTTAIEEVVHAVPTAAPTFDSLLGPTFSNIGRPVPTIGGYPEIARAPVDVLFDSVDADAGRGYPAIFGPDFPGVLPIHERLGLSDETIAELQKHASPLSPLAELDPHEVTEYGVDGARILAKERRIVQDMNGNEAASESNGDKGKNSEENEVAAVMSRTSSSSGSPGLPSFPLPMAPLGGSPQTAPHISPIRPDQTLAPITMPSTLKRKRALDEHDEEVEEDEVDVAPSSPLLRALPDSVRQSYIAPEPPAKRARTTSAGSSLGIFALGAAVGSIGTIAGLMSIAPY